MQKARTYKYYNHVITEDFMILYNYNNIMQLPQIHKAVFSASSKSFVLDKKSISMGLAACMLCTGQKGLVTQARKSIAGFKLRKGSLIGCKVTIKRDRAYSMLDRMITFIYPRDHQKQRQALPRSVQKGQTSTPKNDNVKLQNQKHLCVGVKDLSFLPPLDGFVQRLPLLRGFQVIFALSLPKHGANATFTHTHTAFRRKQSLLGRKPVHACFNTRSSPLQDKKTDAGLHTANLCGPAPYKKAGPAQHSSVLEPYQVFLSAFQIPC